MSKHIAIVLGMALLLIGGLVAQNADTKELSMKDIHQQLAADLFNQSWDLLMKQDRSPEEENTLINQAHASLWHWRQIGKPINILRGEWMICHVYSAGTSGSRALPRQQYSAPPRRDPAHGLGPGLLL